MKPTETNPAPEHKLSQSIENSTLCAFYGSLLTERQRTALQLHCDEDWSLAEVADHLGVSRQNVHELITRSMQKLSQYESKLGGVAQSKRITQQLHQVKQQLKSAEKLSQGDIQAHLQSALTQIHQIITDIDGEE